MRKMSHTSWVRALGLSAMATAMLGGAGLAKAAEGELTGDRIPAANGDLVVQPINHATLALGWNQQVVYVDPVGGAKRFENLPRPDLILLTDIHGDHLSVETLQGVAKETTKLVAPPAVAEKLPPALQKATTVFTNGQSGEVAGLKIDAIAAYNLAPDRQRFHARGRGNGYVVELGGKRVYLSGDTEDIPEMKALKDIDVAFLCMNLPYTMTVEQAAGVVKEFRPKIVYPYHCRGSDLEKFKQLVGDSAGVEARIRDWYK